MKLARSRRTPLHFSIIAWRRAGPVGPAVSDHVCPCEACSRGRSRGSPSRDQEAASSQRRANQGRMGRPVAQLLDREHGAGPVDVHDRVPGCLVGVVVVAQTSYTATMDHFREFAIVKAIGGRNSDIYRIIAEQATIAAVVGFLVGAALAFAVRPLMAGLDLKMIIPGELVVDALLGALAPCLAASLISFRKIAGLDPAVVFRG